MIAGILAAAAVAAAQPGTTSGVPASLWFSGDPQPLGTMNLSWPPCGTPEAKQAAHCTRWMAPKPFVLRPTTASRNGEPCDPKAKPPAGYSCESTALDNPPPGMAW